MQILNRSGVVDLEIRPFGVEEWMNEHEAEARYNIAETCVKPLTVRELIGLVEGMGQRCGPGGRAVPDEGSVVEGRVKGGGRGGSQEGRGSQKRDGSQERAGAESEGGSVGLVERILAARMGYGSIEGSPQFRSGVAALYDGLSPERILATGGAAGANFLVFYSLVEPGDEVVSIHPTYQQLYSIPASLGARVELLPLRAEDAYLPDPERLNSLVCERTRLICINNPHNPSGALIPEGLMRELVRVADSVGAYLLCDEVYRGLYQEGTEPVPSVVDLYRRGISTGSMSKIFSLAGLRMGWVAAREEGVIESCLRHRDYTTISCGVINDMLAAAALSRRECILERNTGIVRENLAVLDEWVRREPSVSYVRPRAGTTAFMGYDLPLASEDLCRGLLRETGVLMVPGGRFGREGRVRIGYGGETEELRQALGLFSEYIASAAG